MFWDGKQSTIQRDCLIIKHLYSDNDISETPEIKLHGLMIRDYHYVKDTEMSPFMIVYEREFKFK